MQKNTNRMQLFYQNGKLISLTVGEQGRSIFRITDVPLAELRTEGMHSSGLLATDDKGSVLNVQENS
ncbi:MULTISPECIES: hypothetical protein [Pseudomonas]|uniref:hypothetical protein n=1 Tax=Pseudomonas TaxID=286 RepID=UPI002941A13E|nr:hypothetical protein [Pseudomonas sp. LSJ-87]MDV5099547.1 hypothetical protein [Pseudomonas sp. LSJ-87]